MKKLIKLKEKVLFNIFEVLSEDKKRYMINFDNQLIWINKKRTIKLN